MNQIILYGITNASNLFRVGGYYCIYNRDISIENIVIQAQMLKIKNPDIRTVYAIDNRIGLRNEFMQYLKRDSMEGWIEFKDFLERNGLVID